MCPEPVAVHTAVLTYDCSARHLRNHIVQFADDTVVVGLIAPNNESAYIVKNILRLQTIFMLRTALESSKV